MRFGPKGSTGGAPPQPRPPASGPRCGPTPAGRAEDAFPPAKLRLAVLAAVLLVASPALASPPRVGGRAYLVENSATGELLATRNAQERLPIASITKLMTVLVALDHAAPDELVTVS